MRSDVKTGLFAGIVIAVAGVVFFAVHKKKSTTSLPALPTVQQPGDLNRASASAQSSSGNSSANNENHTTDKTGLSDVNKTGVNTTQTGASPGSSSDTTGQVKQQTAQGRGQSATAKNGQPGNSNNITPSQGNNTISSANGTPAGKENATQSGNARTGTGAIGSTGKNGAAPIDANKSKINPPVPVVPVEPAPAKVRYYTVVKGDTLYKIAESYYGQGKYGNIIYQANRSIIKNPNILKPGWKLRIPYPSEIAKQQHN